MQILANWKLAEKLRRDQGEPNNTKLLLQYLLNLDNKLSKYKKPRKNKNKMANRRSGTSLKDVVGFCHNSDSCSDHSSIGGLSSDEEDYIDDLLLK